MVFFISKFLNGDGVYSMTFKPPKHLNEISYKIEPGVENTDPRLVYLNEYTITMNAIRAHVGGNVVNFPRKTVTLDMRRILSARRIRLYRRNGGKWDWANMVHASPSLGSRGMTFQSHTYGNTGITS